MDIRKKYSNSKSCNDFDDSCALLCWLECDQIVERQLNKLGGFESLQYNNYYSAELLQN